MQNVCPVKPKVRSYTPRQGNVFPFVTVDNMICSVSCWGRYQPGLAAIKIGIISQLQQGALPAPVMLQSSAEHCRLLHTHNSFSFY